MFKSIYTTRMSGNGNTLKNRFEKIISNPWKFSQIGTFACFICIVFAVTVSALMVMGFNNESYSTYTLVEHDIDPNIEFDEEYEISFYKDNGDILYNQRFDYRHSVNEIEDGLFEVYMWFGTNAKYTVFVDTKHDRVSKDYFNLLCYDENNVAYCEDDKVIVADMFDIDKIHLSMSRGFSETFTLSSAITYAELKDNTLCIRYLTGEDYTEVYEEIKF